ncbi:MAG TPA: SIS domain-containing protein [Candidatus Lustribacter sp.]|nr:SIS domain-containing protein [Candidatus Lustribacter sp.]
MSTTGRTNLERELLTQADDWAAVVARVPALQPVLPHAGERVAVVGCGTSYHMGLAYAERREAGGQGVTDAFPASEHHLDRGYDRVVLISRSGTTSEVMAVQAELITRGVATTTLVATAGTALTRGGGDVVLLSEVDESSVVQTRFATTALTLLRAGLGEDLAAAIADVRAVLDEPAETAVGHLAGVEQLTFLGRGWCVGLAMEAALKLRESAQLWTESYPAMEYRHGPISIAAPGRAVWAFGEVPEGLAAEVEATGAVFEHRTIDPVAELVRVHRLCVAAAGRRGLDPDVPRHLTRSIILS